MIQIVSLDSLLQKLIEILRIRYPEMDTSSASIINELLVKMPAVAGKLFMDELNNVVQQIDIPSLTGDRLEEVAKTYGLERNKGKKATGSVVFYTTITPSVAGFTIPQNTIVATRAGLVNLTYKTIETVTIYASDYNIDRQRYEKEVKIEATEAGSQYNISAGLITNIQTPVMNIQGVINDSAIVGGTDSETDDELREALIERIVGRNLGTSVGIQARVNRTFDLPSSEIVLVDDDDSERSTGADLFVIFEEFEQVIAETYIYNINNPPYFYLSKQPIDEIVEVKVNGNLTTNWILHKDSSPLRESIFAQDYVEVLNLNNNDSVSFTYKYSRIDKIQEWVDLRENRIPSANLLAKRGDRYNVNLNITVGWRENVIVSNEQSRIISALSLMLDGFDLGEDLDISDIITAVENGYSDIKITSVDFVIVNSFSAVNKYGNTLLPVNQRISVNRKQYLRLGTVVFT